MKQLKENKSKVLTDFSNIQLSHPDSTYFGNVDGLSLQNIFYVRNQAFPGCYLFRNESRGNNGNFFDVEKIYDHLINTVPEDENMELIPYFTKNTDKKADYDSFTLCVILNKSNIYARIEKDVSESYILFNNRDIDSVKKFVNTLMDFYIPPESESNRFFRLAMNSSGYYLEKGRVRTIENFDLAKTYNDSFLKEDKKICKFIEEDNHGGLVILHGEKGTGKSTYIKHLINKFEKKKFVYIPSSFIDNMGDPSFGSFLNTLDNHVIILEDCENAIRDRKTAYNNSAVSLLLNMTDGILSDDLNIKFICTFNDDLKTIDSALTRKGRLISKYEFKPLDKEKAQVLLNERGIEDTINKSMTLSDIFYYEEDNYDKKKSVIGFND